MNDLVTRLLALAEKAVDEALQFDYGDPEDRYIYRELQELRQLVQQQAEQPTNEDILQVAANTIEPYKNWGIAVGQYESETECAVEAYGSELVAYARAVLARWGRPAIEPVPVSERLPGADDCDSEGRCWIGMYNPSDGEEIPDWELSTPAHFTWKGITHISCWLPYHALPLPTK